MNLIIFAFVLVALILIFFSGRNLRARIARPSASQYESELVQVLLTLDDEKLDELLQLYKAEFGSGAARYARKTHKKWKAGKVRPNSQTYERFLVHLPKVMSYDLRCEFLRRLMLEYSAKNEFQLKVYTDSWEKPLEPLVTSMIESAYAAQLPERVEKKLKWLASGEMLAAQEILKRSQVEESKIAVSMLAEEVRNIEKVLADVQGKTKITHQLKFPYGTIDLEVRKR